MTFRARIINGRTRTKRPYEEERVIQPLKSPFTHIDIPAGHQPAKRVKKPVIDESWQYVEAITLLLDRGLLTEMEADVILERIEQK